MQSAYECMYNIYIYIHIYIYTYNTTYIPRNINIFMLVVRTNRCESMQSTHMRCVCVVCVCVCVCVWAGGWVHARSCVCASIRVHVVNAVACYILFFDFVVYIVVYIWSYLPSVDRSFCRIRAAFFGHSRFWKTSAGEKNKSEVRMQCTEPNLSTEI